MCQKTLAQLRMDKHMSQRELARRLGVSAAAIGMYETGKRNPTLKTALEIAKIFNVSVEHISFSNKRKMQTVHIHTKEVPQNGQISLFEDKELDFNGKEYETEIDDLKGKIRLIEI